jgi:hypothetical protein
MSLLSVGGTFLVLQKSNRNLSAITFYRSVRSVTSKTDSCYLSYFTEGIYYLSLFTDLFL